MKYEVLFSHLMATIPNSPDKVFKRGEVVTAKDLTDAGFEVEFLLKNSAIEPLKGSYDAGEVEPVKAKSAKVEEVKHGKKD